MELEPRPSLLKLSSPVTRNLLTSRSFACAFYGNISGVVIEFDLDDYVPRPKFTKVPLLIWWSESRLTPRLSFSAFEDSVLGVAKFVTCFITFSTFSLRSSSPSPGMPYSLSSSSSSSSSSDSYLFMTLYSFESSASSSLASSVSWCVCDSSMHSSWMDSSISSSSWSGSWLHDPITLPKWPN